MFQKMLQVGGGSAGGGITSIQELIPRMTSNAALDNDVCTILVDGEYSSNFATFKAFDKTSSSAWIATHKKADPWIQFDFKDTYYVAFMGMMLYGNTVNRACKFTVKYKESASSDWIEISNYELPKTTDANMQLLFFDEIIKCVSIRIDFTQVSYYASASDFHQTTTELQIYGNKV